MDIHGLKHLVNILYREDDIRNRAALFHMWTNEKKFTLEEFTELLKMCTENQVQLDKQRRYGQQPHDENKQLYWLVESNGDLSVTTHDLTTCKDIIENDYSVQGEGGLYDVDDLQYTIKPIMITQEEYDALPEA